MSYRSQPRRIRPATSQHRSSSLATRVAVARAMSRPARSGGSMLPLALTVILLGFVVVFATTGLTVGGAALSTVDQLGQDLPDVSRFEQIRFAQPTVVYDRTGTVELARFQAERRNVVTFEEIPELVMDATISVEDRTFWSNEGYDPSAIASAALEFLRTGVLRGASTISQQFVRAPEIGLLPTEVLDPEADARVRKAKEIIQAGRLTDYVERTYGLEEGKERILTAYLNQIFYGHNAYGVAAAADVYFDKPLPELTVAQAALLAGLPQSPSTLDPYRYAEEDAFGRLIVPVCSTTGSGTVDVPAASASPAPSASTSPAPSGSPPSSTSPPITAPPSPRATPSAPIASAAPGSTCTNVPPVERRNFILASIAEGHGRWTRLTRAQLEQALNEPIVLAGEQPLIFTAPHFVWAMKAELDSLLGDREPAERGGYRVITTLDMEAQAEAEKYLEAATIVPQLPEAEFERAIEERNLRQDEDWMREIRGKNIHNGAMTALDYLTGDVLAYVGSAGYYREDLASPEFDPKFDVVQGFRQPGSAFKPLVYATGLQEKAITAGTVLLDVTTSFGREWQPKDSDRQERGPVTVRQALQYSLNIPAIRAIERTRVEAVGQAAQRAGLQFLRGPGHIAEGGLASAIGTVEVRMLDLTAAYGAFGNGGLVTAPRMILEVADDSGNAIFTAGEPLTSRVWDAEAAWIVADILEGNSDPRQNFIWGPEFNLENGPGGSHRPMAVKTGTANDTLDLSTYGLLPKPPGEGEPALAVGVWLGNSDHSAPEIVDADEFFATQGPGRVWHAFMREYMDGQPTPDFQRPERGVVEDTMDAWSGGQPGAWTRETTREWFISGTEPSARNP
ncbi:MAG: transglycosylase domain-containing protein, partial [Chloroflexi bacterium]|nr:transglycosylase domain-containing protein [Chloroflexota bacterium]